MMGIAERVAAGAAFLDEREPGWAERIDLDRLDLNHTCNCVLGQTFADEDPDHYYSNGFDWAVSHFDLDAGGADLGFDIEGREPFEPLTAEWKRLIETRRAGVSHA